ncbi:MAG: hypothetical protein ACRDRU_08285 [Pseudonocardiaceae bacterium]
MGEQGGIIPGAGPDFKDPLTRLGSAVGSICATTVGMLATCGGLLTRVAPCWTFL